MRVQLPAYTDRWMMGDRYGVVIKTSWWKSKRRAVGVRAAILTPRQFTTPIEVAHVKLDKSGKVVRVILSDCTVV